MKKKDQDILIFDEAIDDGWVLGHEAVEVPIHERIFSAVWLLALLVFSAVMIRVIFLGPFHYAEYFARAENNLHRENTLPAPRGLITDRTGVVLADNTVSFQAVLDIKKYIAGNQELLKEELTTLLQLEKEQFEGFMATALVQEKNEVVIATELEESKIISLETRPDLPVRVVPGFKRSYPLGPAFSSILGYTGRVGEDDLKKDERLREYTSLGKVGIEAQYDERLRGVNGSSVVKRNARGEALGKEEEHPPRPGEKIALTIDSELQEFFYRRLAQGLSNLGRNAGVGLAIDPRNGEILALLSLPSFDNNLMVAEGQSEAKRELLESPLNPLFNRAIGGFYNPGSTVKPLVAAAALAEGVVNENRYIYSPGYLDVPNPYDPEKPTRFLDWRAQGSVNVVSALAQSSNVYFYEVGGGFGDIKGLGITKLLEWWKLFGFGEKTGVDLPGEARGRLPDPNKSEEDRGRPWLLGDTYNVSIGQGDLLVTPLQLLSYIGAVANGGELYQPHLLKSDGLKTAVKDLTRLEPELKIVRKGMESGVTAPLGTSYSLRDLPMTVGAKTGTAQTRNKAQENAFFVGYAPAENPEIAILVLVEDARQGSLNAVPIAKEVLYWYATNRLGKN